MHDGKAFQMLTAIDEFTRRCLAIVVGRKPNSDDVLYCLTDLFTKHSPLDHISSDNGPESQPRLSGTGCQGSA